MISGKWPPERSELAFPLSRVHQKLYFGKDEPG
jgi:hypothetical protein